MKNEEKYKILEKTIILLIKKNKIIEARNMLEFLHRIPEKTDEIENVINNIAHKIDLLSRFVIQWDSIYIYIINPCDYKCIFCDRSEKEFTEYNERLYTTLSDIKFIISLFEYNDTLKNYKYLQIWWHEPLANKYIKEIFLYLKDFWKEFILNSSWSRPDMILELIKLWIKFNNVKIPIYSLKKENFNIITNSEYWFDNYNKCISTLKEHKIKWESASTIINQNKDEKELFCKFWNNLLIPNNVNTYELHKRNWVKFKELVELFKTEKVRDLMKNFEYWNNLKLPGCILYEVSEEKFKKYRLEYAKKAKKAQNEINKHSDMKTLQDDKRMKIKPEKCKTCSIYNDCEWYFKVHFDVFSEDEVMPINK